MVRILEILPELFLVLTALVGLLLISFKKKITKSAFFIFLSTALIISIFLCFLPPSGLSFYGNISTTLFSQSSKATMYFFTFILMLVNKRVEKNTYLLKPEFAIIMLFSVVGMSLMLSAHNLMTFYVAMELASICLYLMAAANRDSTASTEAAVKFFILGALASALFLLGASIVYSYIGDVSFISIKKNALIFTDVGFEIGLLLILCSFLFKLSAAPFHMWLPDVYQGVPLSVAAFYSVVQKLVMGLVFISLIFNTNISVIPSANDAITIVALLSLIVGAVATILQEEVKRLLAFSSVYNVGFVLLSLATNSLEGVQYAYIYILVYSWLLLGAFLIILSLNFQRTGIDRDQTYPEFFKVAYLKGLAKKRPKHAFAFSVILLAMAGLPPFVGFFIKLYVFKILITEGQILNLFIAVLTTVIALYYHLYLIKCMYFDEPKYQNFFEKKIFTYELILPIYSVVLITISLFTLPGLNDFFMHTSKIIVKSLLLTNY